MRKKLLLIACLICAAAALSGCDTVVPVSGPIDTSWTIKSMDVTIDVSNDRTARVTERITVRYNAYGKHGMYRDLPLQSGEKYRDVSVDGSDYEFERMDGMLSIRIGSSDKTYASGAEDTYTVRYVLIPANKGELDNYYMNVIGFGYTTEILTSTVVMRFPQAPAVSPAYIVGNYGATGGGDRLSAESSDGGKTIKLTVGALDPYEGVTADLNFPDNTFRAYVDREFFGTLVVGLILLAAAVALKLTVGKSREIVPITSYYPPAGKNGRKLTPVQMGMLIDNTCSSEDVTSMLFYWASQGYVELEEREGEMLITKRLELPAEAPAYEKIMFSKLFADGESVFVSSLSEKFYPAVTAVKTGVTAEYRGRLYDKKVNLFSTLLAVLAGAYMVIVTLLAYLRISFHYFNIIGLIGIIPVAAVYAFGYYLDKYRIKLGKKRLPLLFVYFASAFAGTALCTLFIAGDAMGLIEKICLIALGALTSCVAPFITRRTEYYNETLGEVVGFRDFLTLAEKDKLEAMLEDNPQYYYDVLPYANVLGVSEIWADKFKDLAVEPPAYYRSGDIFFNLMVFNAFYRRSFTSFHTAAISRPAPSGQSGGGFHGGGGGSFGGGGFGGGGGRSW